MLFAALALHRNPPSNIEPIDPKTLHLTGEFTEANLGTRVEANGQVTTRIAELDPAQLRALADVPSGAVAVAGAAMVLLLIAWLLIYLLVYLPRGTVG